MGPEVLSHVLKGIENVKNENVLQDFEHAEDAGVYKISDDVALVQTLDFFPPIVNDPFVFGQIAVANSLSDCYAMGAKPISALSIVGFPICSLSEDVLRQMMKGAQSKLLEAGVPLLGGHSIEDDEVKLGFSITGTVHPDKIYRNRILEENLALIMTKKIGVGILNTALRGRLLKEELEIEMQETMSQLNKKSCELSEKFNIKACTDITGFGLVGHLAEMVEKSDIDLKLDFTKIKTFSGLDELINFAMIPAGMYRNETFRSKEVLNYKDLSFAQKAILFDPQTSGGMIFAIPKNEAEEFSSKLEKNGEIVSIIGFSQKGNGKIWINS